MHRDNVVGAFSEVDAARLSGLSTGQLRSWDRSGFLHPAYRAAQAGLPYGRIYSFRDVVSLRVLGQLRNVHKVSMQHLRKVSETLAHLGERKWTATTLYVLGRKVVFEDPRTSGKVEIVSGQRVLDIPIHVVISDTRKAIGDLNRRLPSERGAVVHGRFTLQNEPVFKGTRIPVAAVKRYLDSGYEPAMIISEFPDLTLEDIEVARSYGNRAA